MDSLEEHICFDHMLHEPLAKRGWQVKEISWHNTSVNWNDYDVVLIRSPWDYIDHNVKFLQVLEQIDQSSARLENSLSLIKWNIEKTYLQDLEHAGINCIPTLWRQAFDETEQDTFFNELKTDEIIIKPVLSVGARNTYKLTRDKFKENLANLNEDFAQRSFMVQPFIENIITEGEFSMFFFANKYSHTVLKTPKAKDFRVQEEHGGILKVVEAEVELLKQSQKIYDNADLKALYARADFVRLGNSFALMELELIEPSLYLNLDPNAAERFADAFVEWVQ